MKKISKESQLELQEQHHQFLVQLLGTIPNEKIDVQRIRIHQGWWRAFVLGLPEGDYFDKKNKKWNRVCNRTFKESTSSDINFLTPQVLQAVKATLKERKESNRGMIEESRLNYNLLSSQPLCFNFFGELMVDNAFGLKVLNCWWPELTEIKRVVFEFAPKERFTNDNSAFDIAFEVSIGKKSGLIGLECKYTDTFSAYEYEKPEYEKIFEKSNSFATNYKILKASKYNQLFRNQLIAEALIQNKKYDFVRTGLFCYQGDNTAILTAHEFQKMLTNPENFSIITYRNFIEKIQQLDLSWDQREWTMLLWVRYCATILSDSIQKAYTNSR
jgi:hypothetical protein